jgi:hypothetical protein
MLAAAFRYPLATSGGRDALAICTGLIVASLLLARVARALWPAWSALVPAALVVVPVLPLAGYLGTVLRDGLDGDVPPRFRWSGTVLRTGLRLLAVAAVYLLPPAAVLLGAVYLLLETGGTSAGEPLFVVAPTVALLVLVAFVYALPAALAAAVRHGVRAGLSREALGGLASGSYFFAWTVSVPVVVLAWGVLGAAGPGSPAALLGAALVAYGHLVVARLLADGLERSRSTPSG